MNIIYTFPFFVIADDNQVKPVKGKVKVTDGKNTSSHSFDVLTTTWNQQEPSDCLVLENSDLIEFEKSVDFKFSVVVEHCTVVVMYPTVSSDYGDLSVYIQTIKQKFQNQTNTESWQNLPITSTTPANATIKITKNEISINGVTKEKEQYKKNLIYIKPANNKPKYLHEETIEYYLGKDKVKNLFFKEEIPFTSFILPRLIDDTSRFTFNNTIEFYGNTYTINNLGYRSNIDYTKDTLKNKSIILCLGDSDVFGFNTPFNEIWTSKLQNQIGDSSFVMNMGIRGISNDALARVGVASINYLQTQIQAVCIQYAPMSLREFVSKKYQGGVHTHENYNLPYRDWWDHIDWQSNNYNFNKNKLLLESTCARYNIPYYDLYLNKNDTKVPLDYTAFSWYTSIGPCTHTAIANYFYKKINNKPSLFQEMQL
jgi:hypothetical protein